MKEKKKKTPKSVIHRLRGQKGSKTITIPAEICRTYGYQPGDFFEISVINESSLLLKKWFN